MTNENGFGLELHSNNKISISTIELDSTLLNSLLSVQVFLEVDFMAQQNSFNEVIP